MILYEFRARLPTLRRVERVVIKGSRRDIERYLGLDEFAALFGGFIIWRGGEEADRSADEYIGVWGSRITPRLRRILRERGAVITCVRSPGPEQAIVAIHEVPIGRRASRRPARKAEADE